MKYRPDIDGLRAIAVIPVVLFHARVAGFTGGFVGVDVFFVISGYLITGILLDDIHGDRFSFLRFYARRIRRLFPALFLTLLLCLLASAFILLPEDLISLGRTVVAVTLFASNILFAGEGGYFDRPIEESPLLHTWSLAVEEQFYIVFPVYLLLVSRFLGRARVAITLGVLALSFGLSVWQVHVAPTDAFFLAPARAWELLLGAILALGVVPAVRSRAAAAALSALGLGGILVSVFTYTHATPFPGPSAALPCLGAALLIYAGGCADSPVRRLLSLRLLVGIGKVSYSLYLLHWPALVLAEYYLIRPLTTLETWGVVALSTLLSALSWRYVETPFRQAHARPVSRRLFAGAGAVMAAGVAAGVVLVVGDGLPQRLGPEVLQLAAGAADKSERGMACGGRTAERIRRGDVCRIGAPDARDPSFLVWGDSHGVMLFHVIDRTASSFGRQGLFVSRAGCPSLLGVSQARRPAYEKPCLEFGQAVEDLLAATPSVDFVIIASRWAIYAVGERYGTEKGPIVYIKDAESATFSLEENERVFRRGLDRTLDRLHDLGKRVAIVAQAPEVRWHVPSALARARWLHRPLEGTPTVEQYAQRQDLMIQAFREAATHAGVFVLYPHEYLCSGEGCQVAAAGRSLYYDSNHLSVFGSTFLGPMFRPILD